MNSLAPQPLQDPADRGVGQAEMANQVAGREEPVPVAGQIAQDPALGGGQLHVFHVRVPPAVQGVADALDPRGHRGFTIHQTAQLLSKLFSLLNNNTGLQK